MSTNDAVPEDSTDGVSSTNAAVGEVFGLRRRTARADREHERAADRMPVGRDHAPVAAQLAHLRGWCFGAIKLFLTGIKMQDALCALVVVHAVDDDRAEAADRPFDVGADGPGAAGFDAAAAGCDQQRHEGVLQGENDGDDPLGHEPLFYGWLIFEIVLGIARVAVLLRGRAASEWLAENDAHIRA